MTPLRAGLIGLGMMGRHHARILQSLDGVELVAVADPLGDPHNVAPTHEVLSSAEDLVKQGIDYAVIAVPTAFHKEVALTLAEAGIHALVEKPLAFNVEEAEIITSAFEKAGLIGAVGYIERFNPALQEMRRRLREGQLGEIFQISTRRQGNFPARISDVGVVKDLATHDLDLATFVTSSRFDYVSAVTAKRSGRQHEDLVAICGLLRDGTVSNHLVNWLSPFKERVTVVTGQNGALVADTVSTDLTFYENGNVANEWESLASFRGVSEGNVVRYALTRKEPLLTEHEAFRDAIASGGTNIVTMHEALHTVKAVESTVVSAQTKSFVNVP